MLMTVTVVALQPCSHDPIEQWLLKSHACLPRLGRIWGHGHGGKGGGEGNPSFTPYFVTINGGTLATHQEFPPKEPVRFDSTLLSLVTLDPSSEKRIIQIPSTPRPRRVNQNDGSQTQRGSNEP